MKEKIDSFLKDYDNADKNNMILMGHSLGAIGVSNIGSQLGFKKYVSLSPYDTVIPSTSTIWYVGEFDDGSCITAANSLKEKYPNKVNTLDNTYHGAVPSKAYNQDTGEFVRNRRKWAFRFNGVVT